MLRVLSERETREADFKALGKEGGERESKLLWYCYYNNIPVTKIKDWNGKQIIAGFLITPPNNAADYLLYSPDDARRLEIIERENNRVQESAC